MKKPKDWCVWVRYIRKMNVWHPWTKAGTFTSIPESEVDTARKMAIRFSQRWKAEGRSVNWIGVKVLPAGRKPKGAK